MRITFCHKTANRSGGNKVVAQYADRLSRWGHSVTVVSGEEPRPTVRQTARTLWHALRDQRVPTPITKPGPSYVDELPAVRQVRLPARPFTDRDLPDADVVVATWWETAPWVAALSPAKGAKAYFIQGHESTIDGQPPETVEATLDLPLRPITIAEFLVRHLETEHGRKDVILVPNAIDGTHFDAPPRRRKSVPTVGCIFTGTSYVKGFDLTLAALFELRLKYPQLRVVCFGAQQPRPGNLPSFVEFHLQPEQALIPDLYASADVFIHGSRIEGFGLPILEAMACRTPVVSPPSGAAPELLAEGRGVLVSPDASALAAGASTILDSSDAEWLAMSDRAYRHAHGYSLDDAARRFERALIGLQHKA